LEQDIFFDFGIVQAFDPGYCIIEAPKRLLAGGIESFVAQADADGFDPALIEDEPDLTRFGGRFCFVCHVKKYV
jgi:hypothetical protein